jgi:hypothetical protein
MFRLAPLLITAAAVSDETSLMQGVKPQHMPKEEKSKSVSNLLETAKTMLKNGATPDVVTFAQSTLAEITTRVFPSITDAHGADQGLIDSTRAMFDDALTEFAAGTAEIRQLEGLEQMYHTQHKECRGLLTDSWPAVAGCDTELCHCEGKRDCDYELWSIWKHFGWEEEVLREKSREIEEHFCVEGANGTLWTFRDYSVTRFPSWIEQKRVVETWEAQYGAWMPTCQTKYTSMDEKTAECDAIQQNLEETSCALHNKIVDTWNRFSEHWTYSADTYQRLVNEVHCLEIDRWKEWRSLATVECLLNATSRRNGRPCEESTDEFFQESNECERTQVDEGIDHLRINYPPIDPPPSPPPTPHLPCSENYEELWYGELWKPPTAAFHSPAEIATSHFGGDVESTTRVELGRLRSTGNSHCNERPDCVPCIPTPPVTPCAMMAAHAASGNTWVIIPAAYDEICQNSVTGAQMQEGQFDANDDGHFTRGGTHQGPVVISQGMAD